ncbi:MAG TPA: hypothetical protein VI341_10495 [Actinomycetota bacterium]
MSPRSVRIDGAASTIEVATAFGPRIVGLHIDGRNLFATSTGHLARPDGRPYRLRGGHRLWVGPEIPEVTYQPDDQPCTVRTTDDGVRVQGPTDGVGVAKALEITPTSEGWIVDHTLENRGRAPITVAPWAITQLRPGGRFTLTFSPSGEGLQADRSLVLWPYADPTDPRLSVTAEAVIVEAPPAGSPCKVGVACSRGLGRYELEGMRLEKRISLDRAAPYVDLGAAIQVYVCDRFCELETLGPLSEIPVGGSVVHREAWSVG